jgi:hypothetical protein
MVTGAVVKTIELGIRGVSIALKGTKLATNLTTSILGLITGKEKGTGVIGKALGQNMAIKANIVNVYGGVVNGKGGAPVPGGGTVTTVEREAQQAAQKGGLLKRVLPYGTMALKYGVPLAIAGDVASGAMGGPSITKKIVQSQYNPLNNQSDKKIDEMYHIMKDPSSYTGPRNTELKGNSSFVKPKMAHSKTNAATDRNSILSKNTPDSNYLVRKIMSLFPKNQPNSSKEFMNNYNEAIKKLPENTYVLSGAIVKGFNNANDKLQNLKLNNAIDIVVQPPQVNISGTMDASTIKVETTGSTSFQKRENSSSRNRGYEIMQRRIGWQ